MEQRKKPATRLLIEDRQKKIKIDRRRLRRAGLRILRELECLDKELSLVLVDNDQIQVINSQYLNRDYPTNVIAFSQQEGEFGDLHPEILGDVVVSVERALSDSLAGDIAFEDELDFLIIHGLLHLLGYEHEDTTELEEQKMGEKTTELFFALKGYGIE